MHMLSFKEIKGMKEFNNCLHYIIKIFGFIIEIDDTSNYSDYLCENIIFIPKKRKFESFKKRIDEQYKNGNVYSDALDFIKS